MDFDLFEPDEDDDILSAVNIEPTQMPNEFGASETIPEFQCQGEDSMNSQFSFDGFVKNVFLQNYCSAKNKAVDEVTLTKYEFQKEHLFGGLVNGFVFGEACINIQYLIASLHGAIGNYEESSYYLRRRHTTLLLHIVLQTTHTEQWPLLQPHLTRLRGLLNNCIQMDTLKCIYFANSCKGNECNIPAYHLLHGLLEWKFLDVCILQKYDLNSAANTDLDGTEIAHKNGLVLLIHQLENIIDVLLTCCVFLYAKKRTAELLFTSPFPCTCIKEMWLLLQFGLGKWSLKSAEGEPITFWFMFNRAMEKIKNNLDNFSLTPVSYCEFANWLQHALMRLHGYRSNGLYEGPIYARASGNEVENYEFCERITQQFLNANPSEEQLRIYIGLLTPILLEWWQPRVNIAMILWEHFHKKLNSSFYIAGSAPSNLAVSCLSGRAYVDKYRNILSKPPDANLSSYTLFVLLMGKCLERLLATHVNHQAQKLLGRIYTKFSPQKFLALNETGIHHLIELFLVLALCGDFNDLSSKLKDKLLSITFEKVTAPKQVAVAKGHMALWILYAEHQYDLTDYVTKLLQQLSAIRNDLSVSKIMADTLLDIFDFADTFQRGESLLIGSWIPNFLNNCTPVEQERTLEAIHLIFIKMQNSEQFLDTNTDLMKALNASILPFVKQQYVNNFSHWLPVLASDFCTHSFAVTDTQNFQKLFSYFTEQQPANRYAVPQFLLKVLESDRKSLIDNATIMQIWLKSLVVLTATNEDVVKLTKHVAKLSEFAFMTNAVDSEELVKAKEPLCIFIASVGKTYDGTADYATRNTISNNFNAYIRNFEKWLNADLKLEKSELTFRFYSFLAIVIFNCPHIVYAKSKITCFFHIAITRYILPTTIQMGKAPEGKLAQLVHKIWPVLVQGIGRLNFKSDAYINKTLTDLIQKWTPHFKISVNAKQVARPFISCLQSDNHDLSLFVFEKLTGLFLATQRRQADPNACLVITIYQEIVESITTNANDENATAHNFSLTPVSYCEFANWLQHALMRLHGYRSNGLYEGPIYARASGNEVENYEFCERITQQFLNANPSEEQLRIYIGLLTPILLEWWQPRVNIAMILWEHFHKKLNSSFYIAGSAPSNLAVSCLSGRAYVDKYRNILSKPPDANLSSYTLFVLLMGKCLERLLATHANHQAQKLLGRIYTKFSPQKFLALNETGIHHLIELFLVLALCGDFNDLSSKLKDKLLSITFEKVTAPKQVAVAKGHMALWILYAEHQYDLTDYVTKLLQQLSAIRNDLSVSKIMADTLLDIFDFADTFQRGESLLIGSWIPNFLNNCTPVEQERTLEAIHLIFIKMQNSEQFLDTNTDLMKALNASILPFVKQQYVNNFSHWLPVLASDFCTHSFAVTDTQNFQKLFSYFTEQQPANRYAVPQFLLKVLESDRKSLIDNATIMQIWLKSLVVLTATNEDVVKLTKHVAKLSEFAFMTNAVDSEELVKAKEPLCIFIASVGKTYDGTADYATRNTISNNFNAYIRNFEKWLNADLKLEKSELTFRFYSFLAIVIFNCPHIVYAKSKITCFFHIAITRYILPTTIQMGKAPEGKLAQLVHKIWPVLVQGIGRLNFKSDAYINKTLTDLIQKWTPHFKISVNAKQVARPFISCLQSDNHDLSLFVFEKLTGLFLATQRRQADPNACLVITIYQEIVESITTNANDENATARLHTFMKGCCFATLEHIMMVDEIVPSRPLLLDLFKRLFNSPVYQNSIVLKDLIKEHLHLLTKKHLSYYTFFYFELLMKLCSISCESVEEIVPFLLDEIRVVEQKRGAGEDNRIRSCLQKLQQSIEMAKKKSI